MFKKKYVQFSSGELVRTYKRYKLANRTKSDSMHIYIMQVDKTLRKFFVSKIDTFKNCIIYHVEFLQ